jgi:hypothetical protein
MGLNTSTSATTNMSRKRNVSIKGRKNMSNPKKVQQHRSTATETTTSDDEDECSATNCSKPTGNYKNKIRLSNIKFQPLNF